IAREELSKLLEALVILDLNLPGEGESINLDTITTEALVEVIQLESAILRKMITDQLVSANLFDIPVEAFTDETKDELRQVELNKLAEMLQHLEIEVSLLLSGDGSMDAILDEILVSKLTTIDFNDSFIIKGFITKGITDSLGEPHPLAMDAEYPSLLSEDELDEIFKILGSLDTT